VEPIHPNLNIRFDIIVAFITNYFLVIDDVSVDERYS
jgi:hypothetical protein